MVNESRHRVGEVEVEELISAALDDALSPIERHALDQHLGGCARCRELSRRHAFLHSRLQLPAVPGAELEQARREVWEGIERRTRPNVGARIASASRGLLAAALGVVLLAALVVGYKELRVGRAEVPVREEVASRALDLPGVDGRLSVEDGSADAAPGRASGVTARVDAHLAAAPAAGVAEIRFQSPGDLSYGILARAPDLAGTQALTLGGRFPALDRGTASYRVWLHLELDGVSSDSVPITIQLYALAGSGERARETVP